MTLLGNIKRQIPNFITLGNLLCGVLACGISGSMSAAAMFICLGILLDFFDGLAARLLGVSSPMGKELDSLADVVTSGVAPAYILFVLIDNSYNCYGNIPLVHYLSFAVFLMPLFAAYRLAKFNLDTRQSHSFLGLPVPANALIWVGIALTTNCCTFITPNTPQEIVHIVESPILPYCLIALSLFTDILMVSELPMFSLKFNFKDLSWKTNAVQYIFLLGCALLIGLTRQWFAISLIILWYILLSLLTQRKSSSHD